VSNHFDALVADFGLAKACSTGCVFAGAQAADVATLEGTPAYMAPELFDSEPPTTQSGVYSFAMVMWFMATAGTHAPEEALLGWRPYKEAALGRDSRAAEDDSIQLSRVADRTHPGREHDKGHPVEHPVPYPGQSYGRS
jgi:serine/threonine protein kinase